MSNETTATAKAKREKIYVPRPAHSKDDPNQFVGVNGHNVLLPRGKESEVPDYIAGEIRRSWRAADVYDATRERKLAEAQAAEEQMNQKIK